MRRRNLFIAAVVASITFFSLQAFVRPYVGDRFGWRGYPDRYYYNYGPGWGPRGYHDYRHDWREDNGRAPYGTPRNREDSGFGNRW